jgi:quercetin dioxygenase-like cupin family protein
MKAALSSLLFLAIIAPCTSWAADPPPPEVKTLMTKALPDYPGKEAVMLLVEYPPGGADPIHKHDAHAVVYVLEGNIVMGVQGSDPVTLGPGETFYEGPTDVHTVGRNASDAQPAKFVVVLFKNANTPALIPVAAPAAGH